jgi:hypothetical protein
LSQCFASIPLSKQALPEIPYYNPNNQPACGKQVNQPSNQSINQSVGSPTARGNQAKKSLNLHAIYKDINQQERRINRDFKLNINSL